MVKILPDDDPNAAEVDFVNGFIPLPIEIIDRLESEAKARNISVEALLRAMLNALNHSG